MAFSETPIYGKHTTASVGTRVQLISDTSITLEDGLTLLSLGSTIYVGDSAVTTGNGFPLSSGASLHIPVRKPSEIYIISASGASPVTHYIGI